MPQKQLLTVKEIKQLRDKASKEVLAIIERLEGETGLTIASISTYRAGGGHQRRRT